MWKRGGSLTQRVSSSRADRTFGRIACWSAAPVFLTLGFYTLSQMPVSDIEYFLGALLVLTVALLLIILGHLVWTGELD